MRKPRLTQKVIDGILDSTSEHLAADPEESCGEVSTERIARADQWARQMRSYMRERGTWVEVVEGGDEGKH